MPAGSVKTPSRRIGGCQDAVAAGRAVRVAPQLELGERAVEGVVDEQPAHQRVADVEQDLDGLGGLEQAHDAGHDAEHARDRAAGRQLGRRRRGVEAAVARALEGLEHRQLALEAEDRGVHDRDARAHGRVVERVARLERVGAVEDDVVALDEAVDVGVGRASPRGATTRTSGLRPAIVCAADSVFFVPTRSVRVDDLALEVGEVHDVEVDDADACPRPRPRGRAWPATRGRRRPMKSTLESSRRAWPSAPTSGMSRWRE